MREGKKIACFFTAGYTEVNAMKLFMRKINDSAHYIQLCPNGERKSKDAIKNRHIDKISVDQNGMTGEKLIEYVLQFIDKKKFREEHYDAILIEDDKDDRFLCVQEDGTAVIDREKWEIFKGKVTRKINEKCPNIPVIFFYAAPEVEAWFLADWNNSFGSIYKNVLTAKQNSYFSIKYRKYVNDKILTARYRNCVEEYGFFEGRYRKLSDQMKNALEEIDFLEDYMPGEKHPMVGYSKKNQGEEMLRKVDPQIILQSCSCYFKEGYWALRAMK